MDFAELYRRAASAPKEFWAEVASSLHWSKPWDQVVGATSDPVPRWFIGGELNACDNCVDRHVRAGFGAQIALHYESPVSGQTRSLTFAALSDATARFGGLLRAHGLRHGDRILIYMPNSPEAVIAMLGAARIGVIHSVVFGGFAPRELATRIDDATPQMIVAASCGLEGGRVIPYQPILEEAAALARHRPANTLYWRRPQQDVDVTRSGVLDWSTEMSRAMPVDCVPVPATHPLYILYTSGTTGQPKGIVRDTGGYLAALTWSMRGIYDCPPGETFWAASDVGWVVGHSYIVYGPLVNRNTTIVYEGKPVGTPDAGAFWRLLAKYRVRTFFTAPTAIRAIKQVDPKGELARSADLTHLRAVFLAGERTDPDTLAWTTSLLGTPVVDHWWQTETGWSVCANPLGIERLPIKAGSAGVAMPGWQLECLDEQGKAVAAGQTGALVAKLPLPPGAAPTLWNADHRFVSAYLQRYPGYYLSGDAGFIDVDGNVHVMTRIDDVINVAGHRLSSSAMEEVLAAHPAVAECAVVGVADELKGQVPVGFVVRKAGTTIDDTQLLTELVADVRNKIGPVAAFKRAYVVKRLPKTRSGKILRRTIRDIVDGKPVVAPATIEDRSVLNDYLAMFATR